jgi:hypothetical protein
MEEQQSKNMKSVYTVVERTPGKSFWVRVGVGFTNRDGSLNLRLDEIPVNGLLQVREWEREPERRPEGVDAPSAPRVRPRDGATSPAA